MTRRIAMLAGNILELTQATSAWAVWVSAADTFVSGNGDDNNTSTACQRMAPCRTFAAALGVTTPGGVISCVDPVVNIQFVISINVIIDCGESFGSIVSNGGGTGIAINTAGINVTLRG